MGCLRRHYCWQERCAACWSGRRSSGLSPDRGRHNAQIIKASTTDAATVNHCICCAEQLEMVEARNRERYRYHLYLFCQAHQYCLAARPVVEEESDLATVVVRLSHFMQGGVQMAKILAASDEVVTEIFEYKQVIDYPDDYEAWQRDAAWIRKGSTDLTEADCLAIRQHADYNWKSLKWIHLCRVTNGGCPSGCRDHAHSLDIAKDNTRTMLGKGLLTALAYRWKHMDVALKYFLRGRLMYCILPRILAKMWTPKAIREAEQQADEMGMENLTFAAKTTVKASSILRYFDRDPDAKGLVRVYRFERRTTAS